MTTISSVSGNVSAAISVIDPELVRLLAALNGLELASERADALASALADMLEVDARLLALEMRTLPATGLPWAPFSPTARGER